MRSTPFAALLLGCAPDPSGVGPAPALPAQQDADARLAVWFAPDEDLLSVELAEIERVRLGRLADPAAPDGAYTIRYAVYNLRHEAIVDGLVHARDAGVDVQVLIDADQLDPARDWNWADEYLQLNGFSFAPDHRVLTASEAEQTDLVGIAGGGLMHLKARVYRTPDGVRVLTGSHNPGEDAMVNDEALHLVRDPVVAEAYERAVDAVLADADHDNTWTEGAEVNVLFGPARSGPSANARLLEWIASEQEQVLILAYSLRDFGADGTDDTLVSVLADRVAAGVPVVVVTDRKQSDAWGDPTEDRLRDAGVHVYEASNLATEFTAMHHKSVVLGRTSVRVVTDTANLTAAGLGTAGRKATNQESTLFVEAGAEGGRIGQRYLGQVLRVLGRYAEQSLGDGELPYPEMEAVLTGLPGWPTVDVRFGAIAETTLGEVVHATGDRPELGGWGASGWGPSLATDTATYPSWTADPVSFPIGARLTYKLTAIDGDAVRWESGDDRVVHAMPDPGAVDGSCAVTATWR